MAIIDKNYHNLLDKILQEGYTYEDPNRKGINRLEILSYTFKHEFKNGFPAITTKKLNYHAVITELIWFLRGDTNIKYLVDNNVNIWNKDAYNHRPIKAVTYSFDEYIDSVKKEEFGDLGPVYGKQWRDFGGVDQIKDLIQGLKDKPLGTEHIVSAWNPGEKSKMALPPCHYGFQVVVRPLSFDERLNIANTFNTPRFIAGEHALTQLMNALNVPEYGFELHWKQRSCDLFLGKIGNCSSKNRLNRETLM